MISNDDARIDSQVSVTRLQMYVILIFFRLCVLGGGGGGGGNDQPHAAYY